MSIEQIAVIGAGTMGNGIAQVCAIAGYQVLLVDVSDAALERGVATLSKNLERQVSKGTLDADKAAAAAAPPPWSCSAHHRHARHGGQLVYGGGRTGLMGAVADGVLTADAGFDAGEVDADFEVAVWGMDEEAAQRRALRLADFCAAARLLAALGS